MRELIAVAVYVFGFFVAFYITARNGDDFFQVMAQSFLWPILLCILPFLWMFLGIYRLYEIIKGDA